MAEQVDATDLKSVIFMVCGFESLHSHQIGELGEDPWLCSKHKVRRNQKRLVNDGAGNKATGEGTARSDKLSPFRIVKTKVL